MKFSSLLTVVLLIIGARALPGGELTKRAPCTSAVSLSGNPFSERTLKAHSRYGNQVRAAADAIDDPNLKAKALKVADIGTFLWLDTTALGTLESYVQEVNCNEILGIVVQNLPGRDCPGTTPNPGLEIGRYKTEYIDPLVKIIKAHPNTAFVVVIEPDFLPNVVLNRDLSSCQQSRQNYRDGVAYALKALGTLSNLMQYLDAGHGGSLGWDDNLKPGAVELAKVYTTAGSPANVRGFATNVAGWNAWSSNPGEFENTIDSKSNKCQHEKRFVSRFGAALQAAGFPNKAIVDTSRNAVIGLRFEWMDWCNVNEAGFGVRPTSSTGDANTDAFVWVKPGGESDGTSNPNSYYYDSFCGKADAFKPAPEAGVWNQAYFEMLLQNSKPSF